MSPRLPVDTGPRLDEHKARKEYLCGDPDNHGCRRRILKGDTYVQLSYAPGTAPYRANSWVIVRACSTCRPPVTAGPLPCPIGAAGETCLLLEGHLALGQEHQYKVGLF